MKNREMRALLATAALAAVVVGSPLAFTATLDEQQQSAAAPSKKRGEARRQRGPADIGVARDLKPISGTAHDYFNALTKIREHFASWSLRDQQQLDGLTGPRKSNYFTYSPTSDTYARRQDGAKFYKPVDDKIGTESDSIPGNQQLRMPIGIDRGSVLITWDFWYGPEFRHNVGRVVNYKTFQIRQGDGASRSGGRWWTLLNRFNARLADDEFARAFDSLNRSGFPLPPGAVDRKPIAPAGAGAVGGEAFAVKYGKWTRYWVEIALSVPADDPRWNDWKSLSDGTKKLTGTWHMISLWMADESTDPVRILYRVPWRMKASHVASFDFEFNTSTKPPAQKGPLVGYGRNVIVLKDYQLPQKPESDTRIFVRPVA
jgi:hypothetical protein